MAEIEVTPELLMGLGEKLDALELTAEEAAVLDLVLERGSEDDVVGYGVVFELETTFKGSDEELQARGYGRKLGKSLGILDASGSVWGQARGFNIGMPPS